MASLLSVMLSGVRQQADRGIVADWCQENGFPRIEKVLRSRFPVIISYERAYALVPNIPPLVIEMPAVRFSHWYQREQVEPGGRPVRIHRVNVEELTDYFGPWLWQTRQLSFLNRTYYVLVQRLVNLKGVYHLDRRRAIQLSLLTLAELTRVEQLGTGRTAIPITEARNDAPPAPPRPRFRND